MQLRAFGRLAAIDAAGSEVPLGRPKQRLVLALLIAEGGRSVPASRLIDLMWDDDGDKPRAALHAYISNLRRALGSMHSSGTVVTPLPRDGVGYRLGIARTDVDILRFEDLVASALRGEHGSAEDRADALEDAIRSWTDDPLREFGDHRVVHDACTRWRSLLGRALDEWSRHRLGHGDGSQVVTALEQHIGEFPLDERLAAHLATAYSRLGRRADALRTLAALRRSLVETSGLDAGEAVHSLEQRILAESPDTNAPVRSRAAVGSPPASPGLIGRDRELADLTESMSAAAAGRGGAVGVVAAAGIGKSALVEQLVGRSSAVVGLVRCPEGAAVQPFWPLLELAVVLDDGAFPVEQLVSGHTTEPFLVAAQLAASLRRSSVPRLLVIDDLQWADLDTLSVVAHLVAPLRSTSTLLVLTCRPLTDSSPMALVACLAELTRHGMGQVHLGPLTVEHLTAWLQRRTGRPDCARLAVDVHRRTGGNALFARELIELLTADVELADELVASGATRLDRIPPGVGAVVRRRMGQLPAATQRLLTVAAVIGAEFGLETVADTLDIGVAAALAEVEPALAQGIVRTDAQHGLRFSHSLVADALASEVNAARTAEVHAAAARSLWRRAPDAEHAARVARHAAAGVLAGSAALAADAAEMAAIHATSKSAHADAAHHWQVAAEMVRLAQPADSGRRAAALRACGAAWQRVDRVSDAQRAIIAAIELSRAAHDLDGAGSAAALLNHASIFPNQPYGTVDASLVTTLSALLEAMAADDSVNRALVMSALATELTDSADGARRDHLSREAIDMARRVDDPAALARALHARTFALKAPAAVPARRAVAAELQQLAERESFDADLQLVAELQLALADFALADFDAVGRAIARCVPLLDQPIGDALRSQLGFFRSHVDFVQGRHEVALQRGEEALHLYGLERPEDAGVFVLAQHCMFRHDLGGLDVGLLTSLPASPGVMGYAHAFLWWTTALLFDIGRHDLAMPRMAELGDPVPQRPADFLTIFIDAAAGLCAASSGDTASAAALAERLDPWRGRWASAGTAAGSLGLVDLTLARLHAVLGDDDTARRGFAAAVIGHERLGAPGWLARSLLHEGTFLAATGDRTGAAASWRRAESVAVAAGLTAIVEQIRTTAG